MNLTRYYMYKKIAECFKKPMAGKILGISGIENFYPIINKEHSNITEGHYPEVDMQELPFQDNSFDYVISDQVLEHLGNPEKAIDECCRVAKKGGVVIATTCFMNYVHEAPKDFWRFSPEALRFLCSDFSEILQCEGWGNRIVVFICMMGDRFRSMKIPENRFSLRNLIARHNEKNYPIVTWIVARK